MKKVLLFAFEKNVWKEYVLPFVTEKADTEKQDKYHGNDRNKNTNGNGRRGPFLCEICRNKKGTKLLSFTFK